MAKPLQQIGNIPQSIASPVRKGVDPIKKAHLRASPLLQKEYLTRWV